MATDLIQRAAAIVGVPSPNSDQLAAWLCAKVGRRYRADVETRWIPSLGWAAYGLHRIHWVKFGTDRYKTMIECLAAAVVEVDRIEREAAK